jgi:hypothetical protein
MCCIPKQEDRWIVVEKVATNEDLNENANSKRAKLDQSPFKNSHGFRTTSVALSYKQIEAESRKFTGDMEAILARRLGDDAKKVSY